MLYFTPYSSLDEMDNPTEITSQTFLLFVYVLKKISYFSLLRTVLRVPDVSTLKPLILATYLLCD